MRTTLIVLSLCLTACGKSGGSSGSGAGGTSSAQETVACVGEPLVMFGDSHTAGGFLDYTRDSSTHYAPVLYSQLLASDLGLCLDNHAVPGSRMVNQLAQIQAYGFRVSKIKVFMVGYNDTSDYDGNAATITLFKQRLSDAISIMAASTEHVYIGTPPKMYFWLASTPEATTELYAQAIADVVNSAGYPNVHLVDITAQFTYGLADVVTDHAHFSASGASWLRDLFKAEIALH